jgi:TPR repeat protein
MNDQLHCPACDSPVTPEMKFCTACGEKLTSPTSSASPEPAPPRKPATPHAPAPSAPSTPKDAPNWLTIWGTVAALAILIAGVGVYLLVDAFASHDPTPDVPPLADSTPEAIDDRMPADASDAPATNIDDGTATRVGPDDPHTIPLSSIEGYQGPIEEPLNVAGMGEHPDYLTHEAVYTNHPSSNTDASRPANDESSADATELLDRGAQLEFEGRTDEAIDIYEQLAENGNTEAMVRLGFLILAGLVDDPQDIDFEEAFEWFVKGADGGNVDAMRQVAMCYQLGMGVPQSDTNAAAWLMSAAEAGDPAAMGMLGEAYFNGVGVEQDYRQAVKWLNAAGTENAPAQNLLGLCYVNGTGVAQDSDKAFACFLNAAQLGWIPAMTNTGRAYYNGLAGPVDYDEAITWFTTSAEAGDAGAQGMLGMMYYLGQGTDVDYDEAFIWTRLGAEAGDVMSMGHLGVLYRNGQGTPVDLQAALEWYRAAAAMGNTMAMLELGQMYGQGLGVPADSRQAIAWYQQAARAGNTVAQEFLRSNGIDW